MKETIKLIGVLTIICFIAGLLLAWVNGLAAGPIAQAARAEKLTAIRAVLPACDNQPDQDKAVFEEDGSTWTFYVGRAGGAFSGAAVETGTTKGYGGTIRIMLGINGDGTVRGIAILEHKETPGLGAKIADGEFRDRFAGRSVSGTRWAVTKDGGDIDQITAATISSRGVVEAVKAGLDVYRKHEEEIRNE